MLKSTKHATFRCAAYLRNSSAPLFSKISAITNLAYLFARRDLDVDRHVPSTNSMRPVVNVSFHLRCLLPARVSVRSHSYTWQPKGPKLAATISFQIDTGTYSCCLPHRKFSDTAQSRAGHRIVSCSLALLSVLAVDHFLQ